ncbi:MAG: tail fiber domain-containing protein [Candidatus Methylopumilus sp.]|nr:tail fiber domain-containing protein [Candidatus Methylopumilus sp.]
MRKILLLLALISSSAFAGTGPSYYSLVPGADGAPLTDNRVYAGLKWTLNEGIKPQAVVGFRHARTESNGNTNGGDISISAKIIDGFQLGKLRAKYFDGKEDVQGEVGAGYDFTKGLFAGVGVHAPYSLIGLDLHPFITDNKLEPYIQIDTNKRYKKPNDSASVCAPQYGWPPNYDIDFNSSDCTTRNWVSDKRLKRSIHLLTRLHNGLKIYTFKYLWSDVVYVGVMAQDLLKNPTWKHAVITKANGFYAVNYEMLGLKMTTLAQWKKDGLVSIDADKNIISISGQ